MNSNLFHKGKGCMPIRMHYRHFRKTLSIIEYELGVGNTWNPYCMPLTESTSCSRPCILTILSFCLQWSKKELGKCNFVCSKLVLIKVMMIARNFFVFLKRPNIKVSCPNQTIEKHVWHTTFLPKFKALWKHWIYMYIQIYVLKAWLLSCLFLAVCIFLTFPFFLWRKAKKAVGGKKKGSLFSDSDDDFWLH